MSLSDLQIASLHPQLPSKCCKKFLGNWMSWSWKRNSGLVLCWHWVHWSCRICIKDDITKLSLELELYLWASHHRILANHKRIFESQFYCDWSSVQALFGPTIIFKDIYKFISIGNFDSHLPLRLEHQTFSKWRAGITTQHSQQSLLNKQSRIAYFVFQCWCGS